MRVDMALQVFLFSTKENRDSLIAILFSYFSRFLSDHYDSVASLGSVLIAMVAAK